MQINVESLMGSLADSSLAGEQGDERIKGRECN